MITEHALNQHLQHNDIIQTAFTYTDPDLIADIIMSEFNNIIDIIAPQTVKQVRKNYTPYISKTLREKQNQLRKLHIKAKKTKDIEDWNKYKNTKATINKLVSQHKTKYITRKLDDSEDWWKTIQDLNNKGATTTPRNIIHVNAIYSDVLFFNI